MNKIRRAKMKSSNARMMRRRTGNASLELAMFLPFLSMFMLSWFAITATTLGVCKVETQARYHAWQGRLQPWLSEKTVDKGPRPGRQLLSIFGGHEKQPPNRFVWNESQVEVQQHSVKLAPKSVSANHLVLGGVWDHREIPFPKRANHRRLTLMDKVNFFGLRIPRKIFRVLGGR